MVATAGSGEQFPEPGSVSEREKVGEGRGEGGLLIGPIGEGFDGQNH
jgi:hypothetical protein